MTTGRVVAGAAAVIALAAGVLIGLAAPRTAKETPATASESAGALTAQDALAARDAWLQDLAGPAMEGRIDGARVALVIADGAPEDLVTSVRAAVDAGGGEVVASVSLGSAWWDPNLAAFRVSLAKELAPSVEGIDAAPAVDVLSHAIVQALVPGVTPSGAAAGPSPSPDDPIVLDGAAPATPSAVLRDALEGAGVFAGPATGGEAADGPAVDAVVLVAADGPEGAGTIAERAAAVWEQYVPATLVVVGAPASASQEPALATEAIAATADEPSASRPSVVITTVSSLVGPQVVLALREQVDGGQGAYGTFTGLAAVPQP